MNQEGPITTQVYQGLIKPRSFPGHNPSRLKPLTSPPIYAAGVEFYYYRGHMVIGHNGVVPGFGSQFVFIPDLKFGAVVMGNSSEAGSVASILIRRLIDEALGISEIEQSGWIKTKMITANSTKNAKRKENKKSKATPGSNPDHARHPTNGPPGAGGKGRAHQEIEPPEPQAKPLNLYTGQYWNAGYRGMTIQIRDDRLFIDASDRAMGFTLTFHHRSDQTKFVAYLADVVEGGNDPVEAEFLFTNDQVVALGLRLERSLKDLIWFQKVSATTSNHGSDRRNVDNSYSREEV